MTKRHSSPTAFAKTQSSDTPPLEGSAEAASELSSPTLADGSRTDGDVRSWSSRSEPVLQSEGKSGGPDPLIDTVLSGLYRVEARIGEGGMGAVYKARHVHLGRSFAIKVLTGSTGENAEAVERLLQEAQAASSIEHENIVDVVSFDRAEDGRVFLVMELLKGQSLADLMGQPMALERAVSIYDQLCDALDAAHTRGIVHRDLKPENIFIVPRSGGDFVKVLDFGISKVKASEAERVRVTRTGQLLGTPLYMSPEQAKGDMDVDHRADIYSLGVMLYEMLVGEPPFQGHNYFQLLWKHGNETPVSPSSRGVPRDVSAVIMRALEKEPAHRHGSARELGEALRAAAPDARHIGAKTASTVSLPPAPPASKAPLAFAAVAALALLAGGAWLLRSAPETPPQVASSPEESAASSESGGGEAGSEGTAAFEAETNEAGAPDEATSAGTLADETPAEGTLEAEELPTGEDPSPALAIVRFQAQPAGAEIRLDGEVRGTAPLELELTEGQRYQAVFRWRGGARRRVRFTAGERPTVVGRAPTRRAAVEDAIPAVRMSL
ncbi:MAG: serine/threonine-protein kinase [Myxococcota bacterium]